MQTHSELPSSCLQFLLSRSVRQLCRGQLVSGIGNSLLGWPGGLPNNFNMEIAWNLTIIIIIIMCWFITDFCAVPEACFVYVVKPAPTSAKTVLNWIKLQWTEVFSSSSIIIVVVVIVVIVDADVVVGGRRRRRRLRRRRRRRRRRRPPAVYAGCVV